MNDDFTQRKEGIWYDQNDTPWLFFDEIDVMMCELDINTCSALLGNKKVDVDFLLYELNGNPSPLVVQQMALDGWATKQDVENCFFDAPDLDFAVWHFIESQMLAKNFRAEKEEMEKEDMEDEMNALTQNI